jgi:hypothetical protein
MDLNINNYSIEELISILEIEDLTIENVISKIQYYIEKFHTNNNMKDFFMNIKEKIIDFLQLNNKENYENMEEEQSQEFNDSPAIQQKKWFDREYLLQDNPIQDDRITQREQQIDVFNNSRFPMNRKQLGVSNNYQVPYAQDTLNPTLENTISRLVNLDSHYRQSSAGYNSISTDYTLDLSEPLRNVLNMGLYSFSIPYTWYTIDIQYNNYYFNIINNNISFRIEIETGNYTPETFCLELNSKLLKKGFTGPPNIPSIVKYLAPKGKLFFQFQDVIDPSSNTMNTLTVGNIFNKDVNAYFEFYVSKSNNIEECDSSETTIYIDNTLGWLMGFRMPVVPILKEGNIPISVVDLFGPKYFLIVIDDFNSNRLNNGLITITELSTKLSFPEYYTSTLPHECFKEIDNTLIVEKEFENSNNGLLLTEKLEIISQSVPQVVASSPRTLTQAQIYTINEITRNRLKSTNIRSKPPNQSDSFAIIPIKKGAMPLGDVYCDFGGSLQENKRRYFGPVNISRLTMKLINDKGYVVDLHGAEWTITLICEELYQY